MTKLIIVFLVAFCMGWFIGFGCGDNSADASNCILDWRHFK